MNDYTFTLTYVTMSESLEEAESEARAWITDNAHRAELRVETDDPTLDSPFVIYTRG